MSNVQYNAEYRDITQNKIYQKMKSLRLKPKDGFIIHYTAGTMVSFDDLLRDPDGMDNDAYNVWKILTQNGIKINHDEHNIIFSMTEDAQQYILFGRDCNLQSPKAVETTPYNPYEEFVNNLVKIFKDNDIIFEENKNGLFANITYRVPMRKIMDKYGCDFTDKFFDVLRDHHLVYTTIDCNGYYANSAIESEDKRFKVDVAELAKRMK